MVEVTKCGYVDGVVKTRNVTNVLVAISDAIVLER